MASRIGPRSVQDATRFTSTIPHAASKPASEIFPRLSRVPGETPEQRVRRLRDAHLAAQRAQISRTDKVIDASRKFLDVAHRWTVSGLVVFTAVAGVVSIYSVWDMLRYNRARRAEFLEAQMKYQDDALATARLAYLKGTATEEQTLLVEEANRAAEAQGVKLPPLLSPPEHRTHFEEHVQPAFQSSNKDTDTQGKGKGILGLFFGGGGGGGGDEGKSMESFPAGAAVGSVQHATKDVWQREKQDERNGGYQNPSELETKSSAQPPAKKGWWPW